MIITEAKLTSPDDCIEKFERVLRAIGVTMDLIEPDDDDGVLTYQLTNDAEQYS